MRSLLRITVTGIAVAALLGGALVAPAQAADDTLTLTIYPRVAHEKIWGVVIPSGSPEIVTLRDYRIFDLRGDTRDHVLLETAAGQTRLRFDDVRRIDILSYPRLYHFNTRIESARYHVRCTIFLTDGSRIENAVINAHWGLVEGDTDLGHFYLSEPLSVTSITFNGH